MPKPPRTTFYVVYRADKNAWGGGAWFVTTGKRTAAASETSGPYQTKKPALAYALDRASGMASPTLHTQVRAQQKGKRRFKLEATFPRSSDPRDTKGARRKPQR